MIYYLICLCCNSTLTRAGVVAKILSNFRTYPKRKSNCKIYYLLSSTLNQIFTSPLFTRGDSLITYSALKNAYPVIDFSSFVKRGEKITFQFFNKNNLAIIQLYSLAEHFVSPHGELNFSFNYFRFDSILISLTLDNLAIDRSY